MLCKRENCHRQAERSASHGYCRSHALVFKATNPRVGTTEVVDRINRLVSEGWSLADIARCAGVHEQTVSSLHRGLYQHVRLNTVRKIMSATGDNRLSVDAEPTDRRLRALQAAGYNQPELERITGVDQTTISVLSHGRRPNCLKSAADTVHAVYEVLSAQPVGEPTHTARVNRWPVPMAWFDIDDPEEQPGVTHCLECPDPDVKAHGLCTPCYDRRRYAGKVAKSA